MADSTRCGVIALLGKCITAMCRARTIAGIAPFPSLVVWSICQTVCVANTNPYRQVTLNAPRLEVEKEVERCGDLRAHVPVCIPWDGVLPNYYLVNPAVCTMSCCAKSSGCCPAPADSKGETVLTDVRVSFRAIRG